MKISLQWRLILVVVFSVAATAIAAVLFSLPPLKTALEVTTKNRLWEQSSRMSEYSRSVEGFEKWIEDSAANSDIREVATVTESDFQIYESDDGVILSRLSVPGETPTELTDAQIAQILAMPHLGSAVVLIDVEGLGPYYAFSETGRGTSGRLILAEGLDERSEVTTALTAKVMWSSLAVGLAAALGGALLVVSALRPLRRISQSAKHVAELPLATDTLALSDVALGESKTGPVEIDQVTKAFNQMLAHVSDSLELRSRNEESMQRFVAEASHELRNPLAAILGYSQLILADDGLPAESRNALLRINQEATRLSLLVDQLLLLSQLDGVGQMTGTTVDLSLIVLEVAADYRVAYPDHHWRLEIPEDPQLVVGVEDWLRRIVINLTSNAGSHTPPGTTVTIGLAEVDHHVLITVTDDGPGIPLSAQATIFDRFTQASLGKGNTRDNSSVGLGLAIVSALVGKSQGSIKLVSKPGQTQFVVSLPASL